MHRIIKRFLSTTMSRFATIDLSPTVSHVSKKIDITGNGFDPDSPITIQSTLICSEEGFDFQSYAHTYTNKDGCFDLKTNESVGGTYTGVEDMGLFWSMEYQRKSYTRAAFNNGLQDLLYSFKVYSDHINNFEDITPLCESSIERYLSNSVDRIPIKDKDIKGTLFIPKGAANAPAIITIFGGFKRGNTLEHFASYLAHQGFVTLALAFFGVEGLPKTYTESPVRMEYFEEAVEFLRQHDSVDVERVGVLGVSKGGDIAHAMMAHLPQIKAVCNMNGSIACVESPTTYKEHRIEPLPSDLSRVEMRSEGVIDIFNYFANVREHLYSVHKFEDSSADFLMVLGEQDRSWRMEEFANLAKEKMDAVGKTNYQFKKYEHLGHMIELPYLPICLFDGHPLVPKELKIFYGGEDKNLISKDQVVLWDDVLNFFHTSLNTGNAGDRPKSKL
ncbi:acyl-coenzyme A thioesterase 1-like [Clytia hemisphaerica]|uniref:Uncharacterized protein n=1 Tax=Clytia hemisphaerica TaxID=252671 RepID=A0A7M5VFC1_9CNID|eukprot:TCONS_00070104-protein